MMEMAWVRSNDWRIFEEIEALYNLYEAFLGLSAGGHGRTTPGTIDCGKEVNLGKILGLEAFGKILWSSSYLNCSAQS